jgi:predicted DCC family thiol-disulfide oxidoreductase YuxK
MISSDKIILLFDGVCNLCNGLVQFIVKRDPGMKFQFTSLQSPIGKSLLQQFNLDNNKVDSLVVIHKGVVRIESDAALYVLRNMPFPWKLSAVGYIFPKFIRDGVYRWIARNRYKLLGKRESCMLPSPEDKHRFLG